MAKNRFSVTFEGRMAEILDTLTAKRGSKAEVLRDALSLEKVYTDATERGAEVLIREPDGTLKQLVKV